MNLKIHIGIILVCLTSGGCQPSGQSNGTDPRGAAVASDPAVTGIPILDGMRRGEVNCANVARAPRTYRISGCTSGGQHPVFDLNAVHLGDPWDHKAFSRAFMERDRKWAGKLQCATHMCTGESIEANDTAFPGGVLLIKSPSVNTVFQMLMSSDSAQYTNVLGEMTARWGPPQYTWVDQRTGGARHMNALWNSQNTHLSVSEDDGQGHCSVTVFSAASFEDMQRNQAWGDHVSAEAR